MYFHLNNLHIWIQK